MSSLVVSADRATRDPMRRLLLLLAIAPGCLEQAPPVDDFSPEPSAGDEDSSGGEESDGGSEESSSSGDVPADPMDAYGPCEVDADCELVPGDDGQVGDSVRCVAGTCAIRCADAGPGSCPGYITTKAETPPGQQIPLMCNDDGYCTVTKDPYGNSGCPDGMTSDHVETVPDLACMWL